jgi:hypothetical protein
MTTPEPQAPLGTVLHVLTRPADALAAGAIASGQTGTGARNSPRAVRVFDLTVPEVDYTALLIEVFAADSVAVWS